MWKSTTVGGIRPWLSGAPRRRTLRSKRRSCRDVVVQGNPRVYKALRDQLTAVLDELRRIETGQGVNDELLGTIRMIVTIINGMQEDFDYDQ